MKDPWKLVIGYQPGESLDLGDFTPRTTPVALYDLAADPRELHNHAGSFPDSTEKLTAVILADDGLRSHSAAP